MNIDYNLSQALERASNSLKEKMLHSIQLLRKAERIALSYDNENFTLPSVVEKTPKLFTTSHSWQVSAFMVT